MDKNKCIIYKKMNISVRFLNILIVGGNAVLIGILAILLIK